MEEHLCIFKVEGGETSRSAGRIGAFVLDGSIIFDLVGGDIMIRLQVDHGVGGIADDLPGPGRMISRGQIDSGQF